MAKHIILIGAKFSGVDNLYKYMVLDRGYLSAPVLTDSLYVEKEEYSDKELSAIGKVNMLRRVEDIEDSNDFIVNSLVNHVYDDNHTEYVPEKYFKDNHDTVTYMSYELLVAFLRMINSKSYLASRNGEGISPDDFSIVYVFCDKSDWIDRARYIYRKDLSENPNFIESFAHDLLDDINKERSEFDRYFNQLVLEANESRNFGLLYDKVVKTTFPMSKTQLSCIVDQNVNTIPKLHTVDDIYRATTDNGNLWSVGKPFKAYQLTSNTLRKLVALLNPSEFGDGENLYMVLDDKIVNEGDYIVLKPTYLSLIEDDGQPTALATMGELDFGENFERAYL